MATRRIAASGQYILKSVVGGRKVAPGYIRLLVADDLTERKNARWITMHLRDYRILNIELVRRDNKCFDRTTIS